MTRRIPVSVVFLLPAGALMAWLAGSCVSARSPGRAQEADARQAMIDALSALQAQWKIPDYFMTADACKTGGEFDVNWYFSIFNRLAMEPGYTLDYVYRYTGMGGHPVLYARLTNQPPYQTFTAYTNIAGAITNLNMRDRYLDHVRTDGSAEGFFQLVVLRSMGDQFYLFWHALYNDEQILCTRDALEALLKQSDGFGRNLPENVQQAARKLDPGPVVDCKGPSATVRILIFTRWGGFIRKTFAINRTFPHRILKEETEELARYNCGVCF